MLFEKNREGEQKKRGKQNNTKRDREGQEGTGQGTRDDQGWTLVKERWWASEVGEFTRVLKMALNLASLTERPSSSLDHNL